MTSDDQGRAQIRNDRVEVLAAMNDKIDQRIHKLTNLPT
jgi:hypothetical protein